MPHKSLTPCRPGVSNSRPTGQIRPVGCLNLAHRAALEKTELSRIVCSPPELHFHWQRVAGGRHSQKWSSGAHFCWQSTRATTGAPDTSDVELAMPNLATPPQPPKVKHNSDTALNEIEFDTLHYTMLTMPY
uniref:Uncharacterized protein n=1 Tax=Micrurus corallinus TaxID=54390 RepID=A0A2D4G4U6_MICCO